MTTHDSLARVDMQAVAQRLEGSGPKRVVVTRNLTSPAEIQRTHAMLQNHGYRNTHGATYGTGEVRHYSKLGSQNDYHHVTVDHDTASNTMAWSHAMNDKKKKVGYGHDDLDHYLSSDEGYGRGAT